MVKKIIKVLQEDKYISASDSIRSLEKGYQILLFVPEDDYLIPEELYPKIWEGILVLSDNEVYKVSKNLDDCYKLIIIPGWYEDPWNNDKCRKILKEFKEKIIPKY